MQHCAANHRGQTLRQRSVGVRRRCPIASVQNFCTVSRRPAGPLAPPTRRARLRSRWRSRYGGANAGRLARKSGSPVPPLMYDSHRRSPRGCPCSRCRYCPGRPEPVKSAFGVGSADLRLLTEPARKSRSSQLSGAGTGEARIAEPVAALTAQPWPLLPGRSARPRLLPGRSARPRSKYHWSGLPPSAARLAAAASPATATMTATWVRLSIARRATDASAMNLITFCRRRASCA